MAEKKVITRAQVAEHKTNKDCWFVIHGEVYDVTKFLDEHPGGEEVMMELAGKDASDGFDDVGHSADAKESLKKYHIGSVPAEEKTLPKTKAPKTGGSAEAGGNMSYVMILAVLGVVAAIVYNLLSQ